MTFFFYVIDDLFLLCYYSSIILAWNRFQVLNKVTKMKCVDFNEQIIVNNSRVMCIQNWILVVNLAQDRFNNYFIILTMIEYQASFLLQINIMLSLLLKILLLFVQDYTFAQHTIDTLTTIVLQNNVCKILKFTIYVYTVKNLIIIDFNTLYSENLDQNYTFKVKRQKSLVFKEHFVNVSILQHCNYKHCADQVCQICINLNIISVYIKIIQKQI
eukprot:TRINITY_DN23315_c1_g1_i1.p1 TRINITY_DN23315_c1_g1~~TRINITY_DN23315_c1_g1_i1.p1  ORF type:complete len:215 (-),score=-23.38 TRINITY_DN23315_c1_g1_i1:412-1056(-)